MKRPASQLTLAEMREPPSAPHPPINLDREAQKRDELIRSMNETRGLLIQIATEFAVTICRAKGWVTSVDIMRAMRERPDLAAMLDAVDARFLGAVTLPSKGWVKLDYVNEGARGRPIPRWTRKL